MTFPILLEVEDPALASVIRLLNNYPGVAKIGFPLDQLTGPRGKRPGTPRKQPVPDLPSIQDVVIALLMKGPQAITAIEAELKRVGHQGTKSQVSGTLNYLKKNNITESDGKGTHQLTREAKAKLGVAQPAALPAPNGARKITRRPARPDALVATHRAIAAVHPTPVSASDLVKTLGIEMKHAGNDLARLKASGLIKRISKGRYGLTKKGVENTPPSPAQATKD